MVLYSSGLGTYKLVIPAHKTVVVCGIDDHLWYPNQDADDLVSKPSQWLLPLNKRNFRVIYQWQADTGAVHNGGTTSIQQNCWDWRALLAAESLTVLTHQLW